MRNHRYLMVGTLVAILGVPLAAREAAGQALSGGGLLKGRGALAVQRCGQDPSRAVVTMAMAADGTWVVSAEGGAIVLSGTYAPIGTSGRQFDLTFDTESEAAFVGRLTADASDLCHNPITVHSVTKGIMRLGLNKRHSRATLTLRYSATGEGGGRSGWAKFRLVAAGRWTAG